MILVIVFIGFLVFGLPAYRELSRAARRRCAGRRRYRLLYARRRRAAGSIDTTVCMGASIANAIGMAASGEKKPVVATIGDSTFLHSGIAPLIDAVYNKANITVVLLDNSITAMTGGQDHPGTGRTLRGEPTHKVDYERSAAPSASNGCARSTLTNSAICTRRCARRSCTRASRSSFPRAPACSIR